MINKNEQFLKLSVQEEKHYNFQINLEKKIREPLKELYQLDIIHKKTYEKLCPIGSHIDILYGLVKVQKQLINNCPPFRPILSAKDSPTYNIAKFLVPIRKPLTTSDYTLKDTFAFSCDIFNENLNLFIVSLDVDSLLINIPSLDETINILTEKLFSENKTVYNFNNDQFKCLLKLATKETDFLSDGELYQKLTVLLWYCPQVQHQLIFFFPTMRIFGYVIIHQNSSLTITNVMQTTFQFAFIRKVKLSCSNIVPTLFILK